MSAQTRVLLVEDSVDDAELMARRLRRELGPILARRVDTREALEQALAESSWDVALVDYTLPQLRGPEVVALLHERQPELPAIIVSGTLTDEMAAGLLKAGAADFVLKDRMGRLAHAVEAAVAEAQLRAEKRAAEAALRASEARARSLIESTTDAIISLSPGGAITTWNPGAERLYGYSADEAVGRPAAILVPPERQPELESVLQRVLAGERMPSFETVRLRKDGANVDVFTTVSAIKDEGGDIVGISMIDRDIADRKRAEAALRESEARFRRIVTTTQEGVFQVDADLRPVFVNDRLAEMLGSSVDELMRLSVFDFLDPEARARAEAIIEQLRNGAPQQIDLPVRRRDGTSLWILGTATPVLDDMGRYAGAFAMLMDITDRKHAEERLRAANRALTMLSRGNMLLVRSTSEAELLSGMCQMITDVGGFPRAWVDYLEPNADRMPRRVAVAGREPDIPPGSPARWAEGELGESPEARTIRTGSPTVVQPGGDARSGVPGEALPAGDGSSLVLPLKGPTGVFGVLGIDAAVPDAFPAEEVAILQELADDLAFGIHALRDREDRERQRVARIAALERLRRAVEDTVRVLAAAVEARDPYTAGHQQRVAQLAVAIATELGLPPEQIEGIRFGGLIHDVGKVYVPAEILNRPGRLTDVERALVMTHAQVGYEIVRGVEFPWPVAEIVWQHHERLDGSGYPRGLRGEEIILEARILGVADVVEAMSGHRPYRPALGIERALDEIRARQGSAYDASVVDACIRVITEQGFAFS